MKKKLLLHLLTLCLVTSFVNSQTTIRENNFTGKYFTDKIEISFDYPANIINISDAFSGEKLYAFSNKQNSTYTIPVTKPGQILVVNYIENGIEKTTRLATQSLSTGEIKVYFNHAVSTSVAYPGNNAVNLGNTLDDKLIEKINACTSTLDIAIYNSASPNSTSGIAGAINAAYARGVQVRVIYDGSTSSTMIPLLNTGIPKLASPTSADYGIMHNKFVIFDANDADPNKPLVWTGATNWTVVQIDGPDSNNVITFQDQTLALGYKLEFEEMWGNSTMTPNLTNSKFGQFKLDNTPHNYVIGGKAVENYFSPTDGPTAAIINCINSANSDINIATMLITRDDIANAIVNKYNTGIINTNLLTDTQNPSGNDFNFIQSSIAPNHAVKDVVTGSIMHHKFVVIDNSNPTSDAQVLTGSHNWSTSAETRNDENTVVVHDANIANQYYQAFHYLYTLASGVLSVNKSTFNEQALTMYPNPTNGSITVKNSGEDDIENCLIVLYDFMGKKIYEKEIGYLFSETIDLSNQQSGVYILNIKSNDKVKNFKVIKQ